MTQACISDNWTHDFKIDSPQGDHRSRCHSLIAYSPRACTALSYRMSRYVAYCYCFTFTATIFYCSSACFALRNTILHITIGAIVYCRSVLRSSPAAESILCGLMSEPTREPNPLSWLAPVSREILQSDFFGCSNHADISLLTSLAY